MNQLNDKLTGKDFEMECVRYALTAHAQNEVFKEIERVAISEEEASEQSES